MLYGIIFYIYVFLYLVTGGSQISIEWQSSDDEVTDKHSPSKSDSKALYSEHVTIVATLDSHFSNYNVSGVNENDFAPTIEVISSPKAQNSPRMRVLDTEAQKPMVKRRPRVTRNLFTGEASSFFDEDVIPLYKSKRRKLIESKGSTFEQTLAEKQPNVEKFEDLFTRKSSFNQQNDRSLDGASTLVVGELNRDVSQLEQQVIVDIEVSHTPTKCGPEDHMESDNAELANWSEEEGGPSPISDVEVGVYDA